MDREASAVDAAAAEWRPHGQLTLGQVRPVPSWLVRIGNDAVLDAHRHDGQDEQTRDADDDGKRLKNRH